MASYIGGIISLSIGVIFLANVFIYTVKNTSTAGWTATEISLWSVMTLSGIAGMVYGVLNLFGVI